MKRVVILGASGSIGLQTIEVIREHRDKFAIVGIAVKENILTLKELAEEFRPPYLAVYNSNIEIPSFSYNPTILFGREGIEFLASLEDIDLVIIAISGLEAIYPTKKAILSNKKIALATKEVIVTCGKFFKEWLKNSNSEIIPIDSEHSAIFQLLSDRKGEIERIILTASGGPFFGKEKKYIENVELEEVLNHPRWRMGKKTTIDSANLVNKALEIVEAHYLFNLPYEKIDVLIHPQSIVHGIIELIDGSLIAYLSPTDMKFAIQYALFYPERINYKWQKLDLRDMRLDFYPVDDQFPIIKYLYEVVKKGDIFPAILAISDEIFVSQFLKGNIKFSQIVPLIIKVMENWKGKNEIEGEEDLLELIAWTEKEAINLIKKYGK
ncbi:MAG: 1-deoxy-D-xylulose-5-phosphate reductoisomerase [Dictyoglomus sp.]|nr:1-deoxy-D-xylulose-5-phosphate reductoisomerase [Dictyoglomus sp.]MCX7942200.1 1-deoxy-D-xylulose-5-phosphate reductoisomerase [Dictyoglomaceae bacterium]MDW8188663.1 1-deoxy-D-xylulose-5-phosphate reductoisomerase [Dictyoglomus sp.]